jgi:hypothetical protein
MIIFHNSSHLSSDHQIDLGGVEEEAVLGGQQMQGEEVVAG